MEVAALLLAAVLLAKSMKWRIDLTLSVALGLLALPLVQTELRGGQIQLLLLLLVMLGWRAIESNRPGRAAAWIGIATALKLFPILLFLGLLRQRKFKLFLTAGVVALFVNGLVWPWFGESAFFSQLSTASVAKWRRWPWNVSIGGTLARASIPLVIGLALSALFVGLIYFLSRESFWAGAPLLLLALPITWTVYCLLALPWMAISSVRISKRMRFPLLVAAAVVLIDVPSTISQGSVAVLLPTLALLLLVVAGFFLQNVHVVSAAPAHSK